MGADALGFIFATSRRQVAERVPMTIRALPAGSPDLQRFDEYGADLLLLDSQAPGSGEVFDWSLAEGAPSNRPMLLAGGLTPDNVASAIEEVDPYGVDVSTGVEAEPGRKDPRLLRAFMANARACLLYTSPSPRDQRGSRMPSSA